MSLEGGNEKTCGKRFFYLSYYMTICNDSNLLSLSRYEHLKFFHLRSATLRRPYGLICLSRELQMIRSQVDLIKFDSILFYLILSYLVLLYRITQYYFKTTREILRSDRCDT